MKESNTSVTSVTIKLHKSSLITHKQSKHEGIQYICDKCDYKIATKRNLTTHKQSKHEGIQYICDQCDYKATTQRNLTTHK